VTEVKTFISDVFGSAIYDHEICPSIPVAMMTQDPGITPSRVRKVWDDHQQKALVGQHPSDFLRWRSILLELTGHPKDSTVAVAVGKEMETLINYCAPLPDVHQVYRELAQVCMVCLWTDTSPLQFDYLRMIGIADLATGPCIASHMIRRHKAQPDVLLGLAAQTDADPAQCLVYDDNIQFLSLAKELGMQTALALKGKPIRDAQVMSRGVAEHLIYQPRELVHLITDLNN
jgi:FMN phosphatase YigB (HAD superfamily)